MKNKNTFGPIVGYNLIALTIYYLALLIFQDSDEGVIPYIILLALHEVGLWIACILAFLNKSSEHGFAYIFTALLIFIIGFSACSSTL